MEQEFSLEGNRFSAVKNFPEFCGSQSFITPFIGPATCPYLQPDLAIP
jgi:hypothetical protein